MKKYYFKNEENVFTNDTNISGDTKPITACFSGKFFKNGIDNDDVDTSVLSSHSPWFAMKDGKYPIYVVGVDGQDFNDSTFKGFRRIFDFTVSSLSGQYYLTPINNTSPSTYDKYSAYNIPYTAPYLQKLDWIVDNENVFDNVNISSSTKLQWKMKEELIPQFCINRGPSSYDSSSGFIFNLKMKNTSAIATDIIGFGESGDTTNILTGMDFTNVKPSKIYNNTTLFLHNSFSTHIPPHFTLKKTEFPTEANEIKVKIEAILLHSTFYSATDYEVNDVYVNNTATFNNGESSTNCLGFVYQTNSTNTWKWSETGLNPQYDYLNGNYSATFDYIPNGEGNKLRNKSNVITTNHTYCLNHWYEKERQELTNTDFWNNIFVYNTNTANSHLYHLAHKNNPSNSGYMYISAAHVPYYKAVYNLTEVDDSYDINCCDFLTANAPMENINGDVVDFSANDRFVIYAYPDTQSLDENTGAYYKCGSIPYWQDISTNNIDLHLSALGSINDRLKYYISEARDGWKWSPTGNAPSRNDFIANNYNLSYETLEYTIPKDDVTGSYLHISYPITTVNFGPQNYNGLIIEYQMTYEFV